MGFIDAHDWRNRQQSRPLGVMRTKGALSVVARYGIIAALLSVLGTPQLGLAGDVTGQAATYPVGSQSYDIAPGPASTADMAFTPVPGLDLIKVGSRGPATASFSASISGAPVDIRVIRDARALFPAAVHVDPATGTIPFSYSFVAGRSVRSECHTFRVEWRSPLGQQATMEKGSLIVDFDGVRVSGGCAL
jgi:hypothetical protein